MSKQELGSVLVLDPLPKFWFREVFIILTKFGLIVSNYAFRHNQIFNIIKDLETNLQNE